MLRMIDAVRAIVAEQGLPQLELQAQSPAPRAETEQADPQRSSLPQAIAGQVKLLN
jgi:hypothetical protein